jgi:oligo-1,6-glucosidase
VVKLRKDNPVLVYGKYSLLDKDNTKIYAYTKKGEGEEMLILLNFSATNAIGNINMDISGKQLLLTNYKDLPAENISNTIITLRPYEALIIN